MSHADIPLYEGEEYTYTQI